MKFDLLYVLNYPDLAKRLVTDKTTGKHVIWATDAFLHLGEEYGKTQPLSATLLKKHIDTVSGMRQQMRKERTRKHGEVLTPFWVCKDMCNFAHEQLMEKVKTEAHSEEPETNTQPDEQKYQLLLFSEEKTRVKKANKTKKAPKKAKPKPNWQAYVTARVLEIACGEAPFLASRRNNETGKRIPISKRIGLLDRKIQTVTRHVKNKEQWLEWVYKAFESTCGYEFQGDNLLRARLNLMFTFEEYLWHVWHEDPTPEQYKRILNIIGWNIWQMNGLTGSIPLASQEDSPTDDLFAMPADKAKNNTLQKNTRVRVMNWETRKTELFNALTGENAMKFDFVIGNPPYQEDSVGDQKTFTAPVYNLFMDEAHKVADKVELITPARFLFNAGATPTEWNKKMLADSSFKVLMYEPDSANIFPTNDIKGGIAISYRDKDKDFGAIGTFTAFPELNGILSKVYTNNDKFESFSTIVLSRTAFRLTEKLHKEHPEAESQLSKGHLYDMSTNIFDRLPEVFFDIKPNDGEEYIQIIGRENNERIYKYIRKDFVNKVKNLEKYKVILPAANGSGALGEVLTTPLIGERLIGYTETFISIGSFDTQTEADACLKYVKSKFCRVMLGVLKVTQHNPPEKWKYVPLQNFTPQSDIDWSKPIPEIDQQLYKKYKLTKEEIEFIETHVKEMS